MDTPPVNSTLAPSTTAQVLSSTFLANVTQSPSTLAQRLQTTTDSLDTVSPSWLGSMGHAMLVTAKALSGVLVWLITFTTITLPTVLFALFSTSLTFTMNATTLYVCPPDSRDPTWLIILSLFIVLGVVSLITWLLRYRFLNMYARLPPEPQRKEPQIDLFPDTQDGDSKPGLANYLDEFLSAIKVFGYRE